MHKILLNALFAGCIAGLIVFGVQAFKLIPLILTAETYETPFTHDHHPLPAEATPQQGHVHDHDTWQPENGFERYAYTLLSNLGMGIGFALILLGIWVWRDEAVNATTGLLWGLAGFAAFSLAPSFGLSPELPGSQAAALESRQLWWLATALATAIGLGLLFLNRHPAVKISSLIFVALPHVIGAPEAPLGGNVPPELSAHFAAASLSIMALFWVILGASCGWLYSHFNQKPKVK